MSNLDQKSSKRSKWFSNKRLKLSFTRRKSKSNNSASSSSSSSSLNSPDSSLSTHVINREEDELKQVFRYFDGNNDGKISAFELSAYFESIGECMSEEEAQVVINDVDRDGDNLIDFQDFLELMKKEDKNNNNNKGDYEDLKEAFKMLIEIDKGCITPKSLQRMLNRLGDNRSYDDCKAMIRVFDTDGNGVVDFNEFYHMMS